MTYIKKWAKIVDTCQKVYRCSLVRGTYRIVPFTNPVAKWGKESTNVLLMCYGYRSQEKSNYNLIMDHKSNKLRLHHCSLLHTSDNVSIFH